MFGRKSSPRASRRGLGVAGALIALGAAGSAAVLIAAPANAATTVPVRLTLPGTAYANGATGGSVVGVHPGDVVSFTATPAPSAGIPAGVGAALAVFSAV